MTVLRIPGLVYVITPPQSLVSSGPEFGCHVSIGGESYEFTFSWNKEYRFYGLNIMNQSSGRLLKTYPGTDDPFEIRNFNIRDKKFQHATVLIQDASGNNGPCSPINLGVTHSLVVQMFGEVVT